MNYELVFYISLAIVAGGCVEFTLSTLFRQKSDVLRWVSWAAGILVAVAFANTNKHSSVFTLEKLLPIALCFVVAPDVYSKTPSVRTRSIRIRLAFFWRLAYKDRIAFLVVSIIRISPCIFGCLNYKDFALHCRRTHVFFPHGVVSIKNQIRK